MGTKKHDILFICLEVFVLLAFISSLLISNSNGGNNSLGWFLNNGTGSVARLYPTEIAPAGWTLTVWQVIHIFEGLFHLYVLTSLVRRNVQGPVYRNPVLITPVMLLLYGFVVALNISWVFVYDRQYVPVACGLNALMPIALCTLLVLHHRKVDQNGFIMKQNHKCDLVLVRIIVQNGMALYATWVTISTQLTLATVLTYWGDVEQSISCTISLSIVLGLFLIYSVLENFVWDKYLRYTYTVWMIVIIALSGIIARNWNPEKRNAIYSVVIISLAAGLFILKIGLSMWRCCKRPLYTDSVSESKMDLELA
ncbi:uncharacterized protein LOC117292365 [Asterias rubens]|uniref:uncharacterized protein LOC117292365 n=1 Tax=Asterias rubens TaxID=7604 RepID=UPI0014551839|nr:uncharacterized protein LOC117292365 [Asterias rubens]